MDLFSVDHALVADGSTAFQVLNRFINSVDHDVVCVESGITISSEISIKEVISNIKATIKNARCIAYGFSSGSFTIYGDRGGCRVLIFADVAGRNFRYESDEENNADEIAKEFTIRIFSVADVAETIQKEISGHFSKYRVAMVHWWFTGPHGVESRRIFLPPTKTKLYQEYYPDLGDPYKFMDDYLSSDASVLLVAGPPGTGKTTFLRHMITEKKLGAHIIYDEKLMTNDSIFQNFLFNQKSNIMVIEDADTILMDRETDGNKMMARFLSVSDGLIKLPNKKLVFTTNLNDFSKVDQALVRPGRCYGVVHTRPLNLTEAQAAAKVAEVPIPTEKREYTLAELFNQSHRPTLRSVGFGVRH